MKKLYFECYAGVSGDMTVAALLDLGADENALREALLTLPLTGWSLKISRVKKSGLDACDFNVILDEEFENHDHDMEYLYGRECSHVHEHHPEQFDQGQQSFHHHEHRCFSDIRAIINDSGITPGAKKLAADIFEILADAEAKAHGVSKEDVHFHEVGAVDSIIDVIAAAVCLDNLGMDKAIISSLYEGRGTVRCRHGIMPVPVPAVVNIIAASGLDIHITEIQGELITPTGAALMAALYDGNFLPEQYRILKVGLGAGKREYPTSGVVRAMIIEV